MTFGLDGAKEFICKTCSKLAQLGESVQDLPRAVAKSRDWVGIGLTPICWRQSGQNFCDQHNWWSDFHNI